MFENKTIGVVVPAYNEELLISKVLSTMPNFVDTIIVVNDASTDKTQEIISNFDEKNHQIILINHDKNQGLGQSLIDGYNKALELDIDVVAIMAGDAQMSPDDLSRVIKPVVRNEFDYVKGNRLLREDVILRMPKHRYIGNSVLTLLTKFATGYWSLIDPQCGYTAISKKALSRIPINQMIKGYGYNAHILNMLNLNNMRVKDVEVEPVYGQEQSKIKLKSYIPTVSKLLIKLFFKRMTHKYLMREFHPLIFFYLFSFFNGVILSVPLMIRFIYMYSEIGYIPQTTLILLISTLNMSFFGLFFGMWLDMEDNRKLTRPH
ncbi:MAG: glycosyltransferase family 2 protein [Gammaproteobacteria bacterium]|nr:glycosyltransferase family 2 protein [Gammaproteobacteria bacterium]